MQVHDVDACGANAPRQTPGQGTIEAGTARMHDDGEAFGSQLRSNRPERPEAADFYDVACAAQVASESGDHDLRAADVEAMHQE
jgi:hypothetical protein